MYFRSSFVFFLLIGWAGAALKLALPFSDHAVLQADKVLPVWGKALPGAEVRVSLGNRNAQTSASAEGVWEVAFPPVVASGEGIELIVTAGDEREVRKDIVFGEVWVATGQSNMRWMLKDCARGEEALASGEDAELRVLNFQGRLHPGGKRYSRKFLAALNEGNYYESKGWQRASAESLGTFSGVGYFFAKRLRKELGVPVGVIHLAVGGSPMEAHLPEGAFLREEQLSGLLREWWKNPEYPQWCRDRPALNLTEWLKDPILGRTPPHPFAPSFLWNAGIHSLLPFPVKGVLWYQGESNATVNGAKGAAVSKEVNRRKFEALIGAWRRAWREEELPVYYAQLPGLNRNWPLFREMQLEVSREVPEVGMAVTIDVGHPTDVHPIMKQPVGARLAGLALGKTYGKEIVSESPVVKQVKFDQHLGWVEFDQVVLAKEGKGVVGFEVAGADRNFQPAVAVVRRNKISLRSDSVREVVAIRYAWANNPKSNLVNREGLPVSPFRSDDWADKR